VCVFTKKDNNYWRKMGAAQGVFLHRIEPHADFHHYLASLHLMSGTDSNMHYSSRHNTSENGREALEIAREKLEAHGFAYKHLPTRADDPIWHQLEGPPFHITLDQISALKNEVLDRFPLDEGPLADIIAEAPTQADVEPLDFEKLFNSILCGNRHDWDLVMKLAAEDRLPIAQAIVAVCYADRAINIIESAETGADMFGNMCVAELQKQAKAGYGNSCTVGCRLRTIAILFGGACS
jgi:hypothetical protein